MKQNLMETQYIQLAKEQFCKTINAVPFVSDIEITDTGLQRGFGDFWATVHFTDYEDPINFNIEVKSNGEKRFVNMFMLMAGQHDDNACYVFMAPYISDESAETMKKNGYSYMDLSGNCYILTRRIFMDVRGYSNKFIAKKDKKNYLSKSSRAASAIIRTMLNDADKQWQVTILSDESGKSVGAVSNVKSFLRDRAWIDEGKNGFRIENIKELLYVWARDYHKKDARLYEFYSFETVPELEQRIAQWNSTHDNGAVLGGFAAAARYAPVVPYKRLDVYVEPQFFDEFVKDLDLQSVSSGGNVMITIPHDETVCMYSQVINGSYVTSPAQTVIDLLGSAGRGEEAAEAIILKEYKE